MTKHLILVIALLLTAFVPGAVAQAQDAQRIEFAPGATSTTVRGVATTTQSVSFVVRADAGQSMRVTANYVNNTYEVLVNAPSGAYLGKAEIGRPWSATLSAGGDYFLTVSVPPMYTGNVYFNVDVSITNGSSPTPTPGAGPQRINFAPGATSATVTGQVVIGHPAVYVLRALAGQDMTVLAQGPGPFMTILTGADGSFLGSAHANEQIQARLPTTQDYYISIQAPTDVPASNFSMTVTVVTPGQPTPTPTTGPQQPQRINFAPGATSATVSGQVAPASPAAYVLRALAGQNMTVLGAGPGPFTVLLTGADGSFLGSTNANAALQVRLPTTQDYYITLQSPAGAAASRFTLTVTVVNATNPTPTRTPTPVPSRPQRINFAPGATSATVSGQVTAAAPMVYVLRALAGQTMSVYASSDNPFRITITGADGSFLATGSANQNIQTRLGATQDYYITLEAPIGGAPSARYSMTVTVVGSTNPTPTPAPSRPQRINFAPGATSATVSGQAPAGSAVVYVLRALAGQSMSVYASGDPLRISITGADGSYLGGGNANQSIDVRLPATQDYYITLEAPIGGAAYSRYSMTVTVVGSTRPTPQPSTQRIRFAPGATSASVSGYTPQRYVLGASGGQTMYVELNASGPATFVISSAGGGYLGSGTSSSPWSGSLPATQDYYIQVEAGDGSSGVGYSMTVSIY